MSTPTPNIFASSGWQARWFHFVLWLAMITGFILFLRAVQPILLPFVLGMFVAYLMDPFTCRLERAGLGRTAATSIVMLVFLVFLATLFVWLIPILSEQIGNLTTRAPLMLEEVGSNARAWAAPFLEKLNAISGNGQDADRKSTRLNSSHRP